MATVVNRLPGGPYDMKRNQPTLSLSAETTVPQSSADCRSTATIGGEKMPKTRDAREKSRRNWAALAKGVKYVRTLSWRACGDGGAALCLRGAGDGGPGNQRALTGRRSIRAGVGHGGPLRRSARTTDTVSL